MKLDLKQIQSIACGTSRVCEDNGAVYFHRFTEEQERLYQKTNVGFYQKSLSTAGVRLSFKTDSKSLFLKVYTASVGTRQYFSFDIFVNGKAIGFLDNFSNVDLPQNYTQVEFLLGEFSKAFNLGEGEKTVCIYFPWSVCASLLELSLDAGAFVTPVKRLRKLLAFGDSITHGYDALRPSNRYIAKLSDALEAEEINKAIGGECFFPPLAETAENFVPDYITVAYGTNDWYWQSKEQLEENCRRFYGALSRRYPDSKIFAFTPIWRKDMHEERPFGPFEGVTSLIFKAVEDLSNVTPIFGYDFVPKDENYYADLRLHPNDKGFEHYYHNLLAEIQSKLQG